MAKSNMLFFIINQFSIKKLDLTITVKYIYLEQTTYISTELFKTLFWWTCVSSYASKVVIDALQTNMRQFYEYVWGICNVDDFLQGSKNLWIVWNSFKSNLNQVKLILIYKKHW